MAKTTNGRTQTKPTTTIATGRGLPVQDTTLDDEQKKWVAALTHARQHSVEAILDLGRKLIEAKKKLVAKDGHGRWLPVLKAAGFNERIAELFMKVARHHVLNNQQNVICLPPSVSTLAVLADIPDETLSGSIKWGKVNSSTTREQAKAMKPRSEPKPKPTVTLPALDEAIVEQVAPWVQYACERPPSDTLAITHYFLGELAEVGGEMNEDEKEGDVLTRAREVIGQHLRKAAAKSEALAGKLRAQAERKTAKAAKAATNKKAKKAKVVADKKATATADLMAAESMAEDHAGLSPIA